MFSWLKSAPDSHAKVSTEEVTLASIDARLRRVEAILSVPCAMPRRRTHVSGEGVTLEAALASLGRAVAAEEAKRG